jgi:hypothetical protein
METIRILHPDEVTKGKLVKVIHFDPTNPQEDVKRLAEHLDDTTLHLVKHTGKVIRNGIAVKPIVHYQVDRALAFGTALYEQHKNLQTPADHHTLAEGVLADIRKYATSENINVIGVRITRPITQTVAQPQVA